MENIIEMSFNAANAYGPAREMKSNQQPNKSNRLYTNRLLPSNLFYAEQLQFVWKL